MKAVSAAFARGLGRTQSRASAGDARWASVNDVDMTESCSPRPPVRHRLPTLPDCLHRTRVQ